MKNFKSIYKDLTMQKKKQLRESELQRTEGEIKEKEAGSGRCLLSTGRAPKLPPAGGTTVGGRLLLGSGGETVEHLSTYRAFSKKREMLPPLYSLPGAASISSMCPAVPGLFFFDHTYSQLRPTVLWFQPRGRASKTLALPSLRSSRVQFPTHCQMLPVLGPANISQVWAVRWAVFLHSICSLSW